jgi:thiamine-monophosphate kinase
MNEVERVAMLARLLGRPVAGVEVGIGDDATVLSPAPEGSRLVWTIDEQVEGTHFRRELLSWEDLGWRSFMAAASDVAAMGARAWCALSALVLPGSVDDEALAELARGQGAAAAVLGAAVVGGNLARGPVVSVATTVLGVLGPGERAVLRSGAQAGDGLWLAGSLGLAAAGLRALEQGRADDARLEAAVRAWRRPRALLEQGLAMRPVAHAAIDVSDGLAGDVGHLADASGVGVVLDERELAGDRALVEAAGALGQDPVDLALHGGEDYALVVSSPVAIDGFRRIGHVVGARGLMLRGPGGDRRIEPRGFDHFGEGP